MTPRIDLRCVDTHTAGGATRVIFSGLPILDGSTVAEKMEHFRANHDWLRKLLINEPRGHLALYLAAVTDMDRSTSQLQVFFMNAGGYLPTCVHSILGVASAALTTEIGQGPPRGELSIEIPLGVVRVLPSYDNGCIDSFAVRYVSAHVVNPAVTVALGGTRTLSAAIAFCGVFIALVDVKDISPGLSSDNPLITRGDIPTLSVLATELLKVINKQVDPGDSLIVHVVTNVAILMLYETTARGIVLNLVVNRQGVVDRSPCGAGTAALAALLHFAGRLQVSERIIVQGILGTQFSARISYVSHSENQTSVAVEVSGSAYVTGFNRIILSQDDPLTEGVTALNG